MPDEQKTYQLGPYSLTKAQIHECLDKYNDILAEKEFQIKQVIENSEKILKEIPALIGWVDSKFSSSDKEFESRLDKFGEKLNAPR